MPFRITIEETREVVAVTGKEWVQIGTKEVKRDSMFLTSADEPKTRITPEWGYSPEIEKRTTVKREVLVQTVDELDVVKVIQAINGIDK